MHYLFILITSFIYSQNILNGSFVYKVSLREDSFKKNDSLKNNLIKDVLKNQNEKTYILNFKKGESVFFEDKKLKIDNKSSMDLVSIFADKGFYYFKRDNKMLLLQKDILGEVFIIKDNKKYQWILKNDTLKIGKYICYKAITYKNIKSRNGETLRRKIVAWYTNSIPINFGIKDYHNLPGAIVRLDEPMISYKLQNVQLNLKNDLSIEEPKKGKRVTLKEFDSIIKKTYGKNVRN